MKYTDILGLEMPDQHEFYNIDIFNKNSKKIDGFIGDSTGYTITQSNTNEYKQIIQQYNDGRKIITKKMNDGTINETYVLGSKIIYESIITRSEDGTINRTVIKK